jgi:hypothetical protein
MAAAGLDDIAVAQKAGNLVRFGWGLDDHEPPAPWLPCHQYSLSSSHQTDLARGRLFRSSRTIRQTRLPPSALTLRPAINYEPKRHRFWINSRRRWTPGIRAGGSASQTPGEMATPDTASSAIPAPAGTQSEAPAGGPAGSKAASLFAWPATGSGRAPCH